MSRAASLAKYAKAARLSAEAAKLFLEAAEEFSQVEMEKPDLPPATEVDIARAKRALRRAGARLR